MNIKDVNILERLLPNQNQAKEISQNQASSRFDEIYQNRIQKTNKGIDAFPEPKLERNTSKTSEKPVMTKEKEFDSRKSRPISPQKKMSHQVDQKAHYEENVEAAPLVQKKELSDESKPIAEGSVEEITELEELNEVPEEVLSPLVQFVELLMVAINDLETNLQGIVEEATENSALSPDLKAMLNGLETSITQLNGALSELQAISQTKTVPMNELLSVLDALQGFDNKLSEAINTLGKEQITDLLNVSTQVNLKESKVIEQLKELQNIFKESLQTPLIQLQAKPLLDKLERMDTKAVEIIQNQIDKMTEIKRTNVVSADLSRAIGNDSKPEEQLLIPIASQKEEGDELKKGLVSNLELHSVEGQKSKVETADQRNVHLEQIVTPIDKQVIKLNEKAIESNPLFKSILSQVQEGMKASLRVMKDGSEMLMKLKPESLGEVSVKITIHKNTVVAEMLVQSQVVKEALESSLHDLRNTLKDKGFNVDQLNVTVGQENNSNNSQEQSRYARQSLRYPHQISIDEVDLPLLERAKSFIQNGKLDYFA